jgi:signal transduction histidine kinase
MGRRLLLATLASVAFFACSCSSETDSISSKTSGYMYEDTKQLVGVVEEAAAVLEKQGPDAFLEFGRKNSKWFNENWYLFAYDINGVCVFHPVTPELVGKNLSGLTDIVGKPVIKMITDVGRMPEKDAHGWVFYHWVDRSQFDPMWKASYIRKVIGKDNRLYLLGCGLDNQKMEKVFIQDNVDRAVDLIKTKGIKEAFSEFSDPSTSFSFFNTYITVVDSSGKTLLDPAFPGMTRRDLASFKDAVGKTVIVEAIEKLKSSDIAWVQYLWPKPGEILPSRKLLYCRKIIVDGNTLFICSDFYLATPIWMRL